MVCVCDFDLSFVLWVVFAMLLLRCCLGFVMLFISNMVCFSWVDLFTLWA